MLRHRGLTLAIGLTVFASTAHADFMPPNNLHLQEFDPALSNVTEDQFDAIIAQATDIFTPIVSAHGGSLHIRGDWDNETVNASAQQLFGLWMVNMYGGLARRPEVTPDGFAMVVCHELGHHLAGYPFASKWAANEGQSDYFATMHCARLLWGDDVEANEAARESVPDYPKALCDQAWDTEDNQNLCYRAMLAGKSLADLLGALRGDTVHYDTPDTNVVDHTDNAHPRAQCRLDTFMAAALCDAEFDASVIPGKHDGHGSNDGQAEEEAGLYSCMRRAQYEIGVRPACWFKPLL